MNTMRIGWAVLIALFVIPVQVFAQESVESKVRDLEQTIQLLDSRVASLEAQLREQKVPASVAPGKEKWRKLRKGMSEGDVELLLGSPSKIDALGIATFWRYGDASGGEVWFDPDTRKVKGWSEP